jgi:hypothetical protein
MGGDKVGPMGCGHGFPVPRQTFFLVSFDIAAIVAIKTGGLLMAIHAIGFRFLRQQSVYPVTAMIAHISGSGMAVLTCAQLAVLIFPVVGPGICQTGDQQKKGSAERHYLHDFVG